MLSVYGVLASSVAAVLLHLVETYGDALLANVGAAHASLNPSSLLQTDLSSRLHLQSPYGPLDARHPDRWP